MNVAEVFFLRQLWSGDDEFGNYSIIKMNIKTNNNNTFNLAAFVRCTFQVRNQSKNVYEKFTACEQSKTESYSWFSIHIVSCDTKHRYAFRMSQVLVGVVKMIVAQRFSERISLKFICLTEP